MTDRDNLSSVFISHVKILFDILDENRTGLVQLSDIESHWEGNDCVIPRNIVIQCLRNVALPAGRLTFDMLIIGLERALTFWKTSGFSSGNILSCTGAHEPVSSQNDKNSLDCASQNRRVQKSSTAWNGLLKSADAEYNNGPMTGADSLRAWQHERLSEGRNREYTCVQNRKGNISFYC